ncbi:unnamed protein product [Cyclocybe aegerita]|uniref:Uncharacterized protein n=1 Tax=Cyclocybe aegerita TaxID=1973307 RepID=A0A8S0WJ13_CYCAE|nr:unnamed protein product [Cyclocybe aegerita]
MLSYTHPADYRRQTHHFCGRPRMPPYDLSPTTVLGTPSCRTRALRGLPPATHGCGLGWRTLIHFMIVQVEQLGLCIETPREGMRLLQTGDEDLLALAEELNIPIIVVLTKYDLLVVEHFRDCGSVDEAKKRAAIAFEKVTTELKSPFVGVSTEEDRTATLLALTKLTRQCLHDLEGSLWAVWATAQQINVRQKVELSIALLGKDSRAKYWQNLGESVRFQGHSLSMMTF